MMGTKWVVALALVAILSVVFTLSRRRRSTPMATRRAAGRIRRREVHAAGVRGQDRGHGARRTIGGWWTWLFCVGVTCL